MPELPEVETIKRGLQKRVVGKTIAQVEILDPISIGFPSPEQFATALEKRLFTEVRRRGKYLIISLDSDKKLIAHLKMTGQLVCLEKDVPREKHTYLIFHFTDGSQLRLNDARQFARLYLVSSLEDPVISGLSNLGPEPLEDDFTLERFKKLLNKRKGQIKPLLLNQSFIAGIGNIYANEILFRARILPDRKANSLSEGEIEELFKAIRETLAEGIKHRGTTIANYVDADGEEGKFQNYLKVYGRSGKPCYKCQGTIKHAIIGGRSSFFCPNCQK